MEKRTFQLRSSRTSVQRQRKYEFFGAKYEVRLCTWHFGDTILFWGCRTSSWSFASRGKFVLVRTKPQPYSTFDRQQQISYLKRREDKW